MAKKSATDRNNSITLQGDGKYGEVLVSDHVVATIANLAAAEVDGVSKKNGTLASGLMKKAGMKEQPIYSKVEILGGKVEVSIAVTVEYGYPIPTVTKQLQEKVKTSIENMTGLEVTGVNVRVTAIAVE